MKERITLFLACTVMIVVVVFIGIGVWKFERWLNWELSYDNMVKTQVDRAMKEHIEKYHKGESK
jgi:hypothetical protein